MGKEVKSKSKAKPKTTTKEETEEPEVEEEDEVHPEFENNELTFDEEEELMEKWLDKASITLFAEPLSPFTLVIDPLIADPFPLSHISDKYEVQP